MRERSATMAPEPGRDGCFRKCLPKTGIYPRIYERHPKLLGARGSKGGIHRIRSHSGSNQNYERKHAVGYSFSSRFSIARPMPWMWSLKCSLVSPGGWHFVPKRPTVR